MHGGLALTSIYPGIPVPEKISLIYPTALAKRLELSSQRDNIQTAQIFEPKAGVVNVEDVRALAAICLRLETLSSSGRAVRDSGPSSRALPQGDQRISRYSFHSPDLLLPPIGVEMTDEDLLAILDSREFAALALFGLLTTLTFPRVQ